MVAELGTAQAGEVGLRPIGAGAVDAVAVLMVDTAHGKPGVQRVPGRALVGVHHGAVGDPLADGRHGCLFGGKHLRQGASPALAHHHDDAALARLVLGQPPVDPVGGPVLRPDMAAEVGAVDLNRTPFAADPQPFHAGRHGLAQLVRQHERRLVLHVQITGEGEHALPSRPGGSHPEPLTDPDLT